MTVFAEGIAQEGPAMPSQPPSYTTATARKRRVNSDRMRPGAFVLLSCRLGLSAPARYVALLIDLANGTCRHVELRAAPLGQEVGLWLDHALPHSAEVRQVYTHGAEIDFRAMTGWACARRAHWSRLREWAMPACARHVERSFARDYLRPLKASDNRSLAAWQRVLAVWRTLYNARTLQALLPPSTALH